ncbi:hypothetical protein [Candidatus Palauibacter sp.]|uniref:hypothetical protein n=1 Tax=Candidatus Palauibacter sp. TaxID=3101350 RepID=UPI003B52D9CB
MEQDLRNALRRTVVALREQLVASTEEQLESTFGILPQDGRVLPMEDVPPLTESSELRRRRKEILQEIEHEQHHTTGSGADTSALETFILKAAFTQLNRLAALKVLEGRDLVPKCLSEGDNSSGFRLFRQVETSVGQGEGDGGYRAFLELLFDDCASEVWSCPALTDTYPLGSSKEVSYGGPAGAVSVRVQGAAGGTGEERA